jgi:hypothetical protein
MTPLRAAMPSSARNAISEPSESVAPSMNPAGQSHRQGEEGQPRQSPAPEYGLKEQEDSDQGNEAQSHNPPQVDLLARRGLLEHLGVVFEWELAVIEAILDVAGHGAEAATADVGFDVDVALDGVTLDDRRRRLGAHVGHLFQWYVTAARRVDQQVADALRALAHVGHALHDDLEHLLLAEDVADHYTLQQHGRRPADVTRPKSIRFCSGEVRFDREYRLLGHSLDTWVDDTLDPAHELLHLVRLAA